MCLLSFGPDEVIDFGHFNVVEFLHSLFNLVLATLTSTMNTSVLLSFVFFTVDSVLRECGDGMEIKLVSPGAAFPEIFGLHIHNMSWAATTGDLQILFWGGRAVYANQYCFLSLQNLGLCFSFRRNRNAHLHLWYRLGEKQVYHIVDAYTMVCTTAARESGLDPVLAFQSLE